MNVTPFSRTVDDAMRRIGAAVAEDKVRNTVTQIINEVMTAAFQRGLMDQVRPHEGGVENEHPC